MQEASLFKQSEDDFSLSLSVCVSDLLFFLNKSSAHLMLIKNFLEEREVLTLSLHMGSAPADTALCRILFMVYLRKNISTGVIRYVSCVSLSKPLWGMTKGASVCFPCRETEARCLAGERMADL